MGCLGWGTRGVFLIGLSRMIEGVRTGLSRMRKLRTGLQQRENLVFPKELMGKLGYKTQKALQNVSAKHNVAATVGKKTVRGACPHGKRKDSCKICSSHKKEN